MSVPDHVALARSSSRAEFVAACGFPFLVGTVTLVRPRTPHLTQTGPALDSFESDQQTTVAVARREVGEVVRAMATPMVLAVRKVQSTFPTMITVGRTANNDIVLADMQVSKFHAFFRVSPERIELFDAGSRNGSWVSNQLLVGKGPAGVVRLGDVVRFAHLDFNLLDAGATWNELQRSRTGKFSPLS